MAAPPRGTRITIEVPRDVQEQLETLARGRSSDIYGEINRALGLYLYLNDKTRDGNLNVALVERGETVRENIRL